MHEDRRDSLFLLPGELLLPGPVAAQTDLGVAPRIDVALLDQPVHRGPVRDLDAEDLRYRCRCECRNGPGRPGRASSRRPERRARRCRGLRRARSAPLRQTAPRPRSVRSPRGCARDRPAAPGRLRSPRPAAARRRPPWPPGGAVRGAGGADPARPEARARPVGDEVVGGSADDGGVHALQLDRVLGVGNAAEGEQPGVVGLLTVLAPAFQRVDHDQHAITNSRIRRLTSSGRSYGTQCPAPARISTRRSGIHSIQTAGESDQQRRVVLAPDHQRRHLQLHAT